jgi:hypothetical protein
MEEEKEPNSRRFWRLNDIAALEMTKSEERDAVTPEDLEAIRANNAELAELKAREAAVKIRHAARLANQQQKTDRTR